jgi:energy-coupling factor transporter ATP-binding protein EcfA2
MTRSIRLSRIHAINWYGYRDSISVEGNLLLAGVTGSGKSILMDLIQLVLVGDQRLVRFNQSATGDRSDRSLKGYCLGDTKQEENGVTQYMRQSAISYVALEFTWPNGKRVETWGLRIEFTSTAETHGRISPFFIPASLDQSGFVAPDRRPLDLASFKALVENLQGRLYAEGLDAYLRDMAQPTHLNFDRAILRALMPTAMSFTFLKSFNEFARQFILPADRLDVSDVTSAYRAFVGYERDLQLLNDQFTRLQVIHETARRWENLKRDRALAQYLEAELRHQHASAQLASDESRFAELRHQFATEETRLFQLDDSIPDLGQRIDRIKSAINETPEGRHYAGLKSQTEALARRVSQLSGIGSTVEQAFANRLRNARAWLAQLRLIPLDLDPATVTTLESAIQALEHGGVARATESLRALRTAAQQAAASAQRAANPTQKRLGEIRSQLGHLREAINALRIGKLPFPSRLLDALNSTLPHSGTHKPACHLRELCEVLDERWRPAIEVAFTRKFAVIVTPEHFDLAEQLYHQLKPTELGADTGRESLVNPTRAAALARTIHPDSLAAKLHCPHPVAQAIVSHLFGDLICVDRREDLRRHEAAILPDGFTQRGPFIGRTRFYDDNPFVGRKGLEQQQAWKERQVADLEAEERRLLPLDQAMKQLGEAWESHFPDLDSLMHDLGQAADLPRIEAELNEAISRLNQIDRSHFDDLAREQKELEATLAKLTAEQRELLQSPRRRDVQQLETHLIQLRQRTALFADRFSSIAAQTDVSRWLTRLDELRAGMLGQFPVLEVAADRFKERYHECDRDAAAAWQELKALREQLALTHSRFDDLPVEAPDNAAYDRQFEGLRASEIPDYQAKSQRERQNWEKLFRTQILEKLHTALSEVVNLLNLLNSSLRKRPIGSHTYEIRYRRNPDYQLYHDLLEASALAREDDLFFATADTRFRDAINYFLNTLTEAPDSAEAARLLDYRHYYEYDMEVVEADGRKTSVDRHSGKFSGGENQSPYFIAILASYLRAYRRYSSRRNEPTLGLVPIDEAFSKLSGERIKDCITALKAFDLQGVFSMSTGNIPYAFEHCDWLVIVSKEETRVGRHTSIRNLPISLARDSEAAQRLVGG